MQAIFLSFRSAWDAYPLSERTKSICPVVTYHSEKSQTAARESFMVIEPTPRSNLSQV